MLIVTENSLPTFEARLFDIRARLGEGARKPLSFRDLDELVYAKTGRRIHASELSRLETGKRNPLLQDIEAIAEVDPEHRGRAWLAWGADAEDSD